MAPPWLLAFWFNCDSRKRFTEEQIVSFLNELDAGMKTEEVCRHHGIWQNTFGFNNKEYGCG